MNYVKLGNTGLTVSKIALGSGGHSRIGQSKGTSAEHSVSIVTKALEAGINMIDSAEAYRTEELVGAGIAEWPRADVVLSTKCSPKTDGVLKTAAQVRASLENSLKRLGTDYVDIYHMHGVAAEDYAYIREDVVPALQDMKQAGLIRNMGITEAFSRDMGHETLQLAVADDCWDVFMVGFNLLNQTARERVLEPAKVKGIGTLDMFAVRTALSSKENLALRLKDLAEKGVIDEDWIDYSDPLGFLLRRGGYQTLTELAYRFCVAEPCMDVILSGTSNLDHLESNIRDILAGPMPEEDRKTLMDLFARVDCASGE